MPGTVTLFCLLSGEPFRKAFAIHIGNNEPIFILKELVKERRQMALGGVKAVDLDAYCVSVPSGDLAALKLAIGHIHQQGSGLGPWDIVRNIFPSPAKSHIHVIIRARYSPTKPEEGHLDSRVRCCLDGSPGSEPKPSRFQQSSEYLGKNRELYQRITDNTTRDPEIYADPARLLQLPFPFLSDTLPSDRFEFSEAGFSYMGREKFTELWGKASQMRETPYKRDLFLYGTVGYGKSHMLACLALLLIQRGEGVVYLPDCRAMLGNIVPYIKEAMLLTFGDSAKQQERVLGLRSEADIENFFVNQSPLERIFFIIDQWDALDPDGVIGRDAISNEAKDRVKVFLNKITATHRRIRSASVNYYTINHMEQERTNYLKICVQGGLSQKEVREWWKKHENYIESSGYTKEEVEDLTGCVPLLLDSTIRNGKKVDLAAAELKNVSTQVQQFVRSKWSQLQNDPARWERYVSSMNACILNLGSIGDIEPDLCDHRYFFSQCGEDEVERGFSICGVARNALAKILRCYGGNWASEHHIWLQYLPSVIRNPSVTGFLIEHACLSSIALHGLTIGMDLSTKMVSKPFPGNYPNYDLGEELVIYCPTKFNFPAIDALIVRLRRTESTTKAWLFPLRVAITKEHSDSEEDFFAHWAEWCAQLSGFEVEAHFLWITNDNHHSTKEFKGKARSSTRGENSIQPHYTSHRVPLSLVSKDISARLRNSLEKASLVLQEEEMPEGYTPVLIDSDRSSTVIPARKGGIWQLRT